MAPRTTSQLRQRRQTLRRRDNHVENLIRKGRRNRDTYIHELKEEQKERTRLRTRRKELKEELEKEILRDQRGRGRHPEKWENWAESRRDELADMVDASLTRTDRLLEKLLEERHNLRDLIKREKEIERRIEIVTRKIQRRKKKDGQLTKDFYVWEFDCKDGTSIEEFCPYIIPHLESLCKQHLQPRRNAGGLIIVTSGLRHHRYNISVGGALYSYHRYEYRRDSPAVDHVQQGTPASEVQRWYDRQKSPPDGMGYYAGFTHIDDRGYRSRWYGAA